MIFVNKNLYLKKFLLYYFIIKRDRMGLFHAVNIQDETATALSIRKKRNKYIITESALLDSSELTSFLTKNRSLYLSIDQEDILNEKISIPTAIKKDNIIRNMILRQFNDIIQDRKILLNYHKLSENTSNDTTIYQVDGVYEDTYTNTLNTLAESSEIKSATSSIYALFGLAEQCIKDDSYLLVYTQGNKVDILAVHKGVPIFNRVASVMTDDPESLQMSIVNEISTTITYIKRQFYDIEFSVISLSGSIAMDEMVSENIYTLTQIPVSVLYPNTFMLGLPNEKAQHFIIALGSYFVPKSCQFLPFSLIGKYQYQLSQNILLVASILVFLSVSLFTYEAYERYNESLGKYESVKDRLIQLVRSTDTYKQDELQYSLEYLQIGEKYLRYHPSDLLLLLKPLIILQKPEQINWEHHENEPEFSVKFTKSFESLDALYQFEKRFQKQFKQINSVQPITFLNQTNYIKMDFEGIVSVKKPEKAAPMRRRR